MKNLIVVFISLFTLSFSQNMHAAVGTSIAPNPEKKYSLTSENPGEVVTLRKGTSVTLRLRSDVKSSDISEGSIVPLEVYGNIVINGKPAVASGLYAEGRVVKVKKPGVFGRGAVVKIVPVCLHTVDQKRVKLAGNGLKKTGDDRQLLALGSSTLLPVVGVALISATPVGVALLPFVGSGLFVRGKEVTITRGTEISAFIGENVVVSL